MIESALEAGFASAGVDVLLTGPLPTPGVAYLTRALRLSLGVVISASHNAYPDNGIKFFSARGEKLPDTWERQVEDNADRTGAVGRRRPPGQGPSHRRCPRALHRILQRHVQQRVVAEGPEDRRRPRRTARPTTSPRMSFHELGAEVVAIGCSPNGTNINAGFGATAPAALVAAVAAQGADYGVALDGDADRLQLVDRTGRLYNGDELLYVMVADRLAQGVPVPGAVGTLMTNMAVEVALQRLGVEFVRAKVGDRYVLEELVARGWQLGGEGSGHLLSLDKHTTGGRHRQRIARAPGGGQGRAVAVGHAARREPVPANLDQRSVTAGQRLAGQRGFA